MDVKTYTSPTVQLTAAVSYEDYCRKMRHQKTDPKLRERGKSKGKTAINCHARDLAAFTSLADLVAVIKAVAVNGRTHRVVIRRTATPPVVSKPSI